MNCAQLLFSVGWVSYPVHIMVDNFRIEQQFENDFCKILNMNEILEHWLVQREVHEFLIKLCPNPYIPIFSYPAIKFLELSNLGKTMYRNKIYRQNFLSKSILVWIQDLFTLVNHLFTLIIKKKKMSANVSCELRMKLFDSINWKVTLIFSHPSKLFN